MAVKTLVTLPPLGPATIKWSLVRPDRRWGESASMGFQSEYRPGARWEADLVFPSRKGLETQILEALLTRASRGDHAVLVPDWNSVYQGTFNPTEMIANATFTTEAHWFTGLDAQVSIRDFEAHLSRSSTGNAALQHASAPGLIGGAKYVLRVGWRRGGSIRTNEDHLKVVVGQLANPDAGNTGVGASGVITRLLSPGSNISSIDLQLSMLDTTIGSHIYIDYVSLSRCATVASNISNSRLSIEGLPSSQVQVLTRGQMIEVGTKFEDEDATTPNQGWSRTELKRVIGHVDTRAAGIARIEVEPPFRNTPPVGAPVIVYRPSAPMVFGEPGFSADRQVSSFTGIGIKLVEDIHAFN